MKEKFKDALILMHKDDVKLLNHLGEQCSMADVEEVEIPCIDGFLDENSKNLKLGENEIKIIHTPGHTPGSASLYIPDERLLLSGDTLFQGSIGRTDLPGGDFEAELDSIRNKLFRLPDETAVLSGHGPSTTIAWERQHNYYI